MIPTLLKPNLYSIKNELIREYRQRFWNRTTFAALFILFILYGMYAVSLSFFLRLKVHEIYTPALLESFLSVSLIALLSVTCFSAIITALGALFSSKELHTLLLAPLSTREIFFSKFIYIYLLATWMFLLVSISFGFGIIEAFDIPFGLAAFWFFNFVSYSIIPTSLGIIAIIIFANIIPAERLREVIILTVIVGLFLILTIDHQAPLNPKIPESFAKAIAISNQFPLSKVDWLPSSYLSKIVTDGLSKQTYDFESSLKLFAISASTLALCFLSFKFFFLRGWSRSTNSNIQRISYKSDILGGFGNFFFREPSTFRAFAGKEFRSFLRDTTQSVQLLLLLTLTFIYLYNFRVMHASTIINDSFRTVWYIVLCSANILFGGCVTAAICTRFAYPSISLEGNTFQVIRTTPLSIRDFVKAKFLTWYIPISCISIILFVSGAWAISADLEIVISFALISLFMTASLVALAIGAGSLYARFDWDNPIQVISSFGSLAYMFMAMISIGVNLIPATILFAVCYSKTVEMRLLFVDRTFAIVGILFTILIINAIIMKRALISAEVNLAKNEKIV